MSESISEEVLEQLEAEAMVADVEPEELTVVPEHEMEETNEQIEELESEVEEKEAEVEQLQEMIEEKDEKVEELQEDIEAVAEGYAEELARDSEVLDKEDFLDRFEFEELKEKADALDSAGPAPESGDPGAGYQTTEGSEPEEPEGDDLDLSEQEELAAQSFRKRARKTGKDYWEDIAEEIESE